MAYLDKIYVAFDNSNDLEKYEELKSWVQSDGSPFNFYDGFDIARDIEKVNDDILKLRLKERMLESKVCVVLIGQYSKSYRKYTRWQIECAINNDIPIIAINTNGIRSVDFDRCPTTLKKNLSLHIAFQAPILEYSLMNWPESHKNYREKEKNYNIRYGNEVYEQLQLEPYDL